MHQPGYCMWHPSIRISSEDGMFDGVCCQCEGEEQLADEAWQYDNDNSFRLYCRPITYINVHSRFYIKCESTEDDNIPF